MDKEKKLAALKNRRARLWDFFANPRAIVCDGRSTQRFQELCEINNEIARLEGGVDPAVSDGEAWIRQILSADHDQSTWPLVWTGLVQIDDDKLTFEFVERRATSD